MKVEITLLEKSTLEDFADKHDLIMVVEEKNTKHPSFTNGNYVTFSAHFRNVKIKLETGSGWDGYGSGQTPELAIEKYGQEISCETLIAGRREIEVPYILSALEKEES